MIFMLRIPFLNKLNRRKTVSVVRLNGLISSGARGGISDSVLAPTLEKAFRKGNPSTVAFIINSPGGSPVQSLLSETGLKDYRKKQRCLLLHLWRMLPHLVGIG